MENKEIEKIKQEKLEELKSLDFKYYCSLCLIIRDENEYLEEWLKWHIKQGIQHFYIYDHSSKQPVSDFIAAHAKDYKSKVTVINWRGSYPNPQIDAYNNCLAKYGKESRWIGFIDVDEQVRMNTGQSVPEFLKYYESYAGVFVVWNMYGANGHVEKTAQPLRERFNTLSLSKACDGMGKVFVQPLLMKNMIIHNGHPIEGFIVVDEKKEYVDEGHLWKGNSTTRMICVDHYFTKSYQEWLEKLRRGRCNPYYARNYFDFFEYNPEMDSCCEDVYPTQEFDVSAK
ncbi:MAG: glycosyltransferase family 2 protein [Firmicutes bacterium]|nr:glycosyltransferase family 2 protein [Bacillota bacterium]